MEPVTVTCPMPDSEVFRACSPVKFKASLDRFYQTTNNGILEDVTNRWGGQPSVIGRGLGMIVGPINGQPGNDIFIANDMTNNHLWSLHPSEQSESEDPMLVESAMLRGLGTDDRAIAQGSMGIAAADLNRDGDLDFMSPTLTKNTTHCMTTSLLTSGKISPPQLNLLRPPCHLSASAPKRLTLIQMDRWNSSSQMATWICSTRK